MGWAFFFFFGLVCAYPQRGEERRVSNLATPRFLGSSKEINGWTFFLPFFFSMLLAALVVHAPTQDYSHQSAVKAKVPGTRLHVYS